MITATSRQATQDHRYDISREETSSTVLVSKDIT